MFRKFLTLLPKGILSVKYQKNERYDMIDLLIEYKQKYQTDIVVKMFEFEVLKKTDQEIPLADLP